MMLAAKDKKKIRLFFYIIIFLFLSTVNFYNYKEKKNDLFFPINNVEVIGLDKIDKEKIFHALNFFKQKSIFNINQKDIQNILGDFKLIKSFKVKRSYPSKITFFITEAKFIGIILKDQKKYFLAEHGKIFLFNTDLYTEKLPIIYGKNAEKYFKKFNSSLKKNKFDLTLIKNYYFFQSNRWDLILNSGLVIKLPIDNMDKAIKLANKLIKDVNFKNLKIIDLRINDRVITTS